MPKALKISDYSVTEAEYLAICKKELAIKIELKSIREEKKGIEEQLAKLNIIGQIIFDW